MRDPRTQDTHTGRNRERYRGRLDRPADAKTGKAEGRKKQATSYDLRLYAKP